MSKFEHPLKKASLKVLEDWAMMLVEEVIEPGPDLFDPNAQFFMSSVNLKGPISGSVAIVAQLKFMQVLASNVLGQNSLEHVSSEDAEDAYREMGNILAGNFLTEAYGTDVSFDLLDPRVDAVSYADFGHFVDRNIVFEFQADDVPVAVSFSIKRE